MLTVSLYDLRLKCLSTKLKQLFTLKFYSRHAQFMKLGVFVMKHILVGPEEMLELEGTNMKILRKS